VVDRHRGRDVTVSRFVFSSFFDNMSGGPPVHPSRARNFQQQPQPQQRRQQQPQPQPRHQPEWMAPPPPPPPPEHIVLTVPGGGEQQRLLMGTREQFNVMRVELVRAMSAHVQACTHGQFSLQHWLVAFHGSNPPLFGIAFDALPPIYDTNTLPLLVRERLVGGYWFVNHVDNGGVLSPGQVVDLSLTLFRLGKDGYLKPAAMCPHDRTLLKRFRALLDYAVTESLPLEFCGQPPTAPLPPQPEVVAAAAAAAAAPFGYIEEPPAPPPPPLDVSQALKALRPLTDPPYHPSSPPSLRLNKR
jgi:hypothetical protein